MLAATRKFAKSWVAAVLMGLLIVSFAVFGIGDVFNGRMGDWVVKAGQRELSGPDFKRVVDNWRQQAEQQAGQPLTVETIVEQGFDRRLLDQAAAREGLAELIRRMGVVPSDKLVAEELRKSPGLFNPITGAFDEQIYQQRLAENGLTPKVYERLLRDDIAQDHVTAGMAAGLRAPRIYGALQAAYALEQRDLSYFQVTAQSVGQPPAPTDAEIQAFMKENAQRLMRPEFRALQVVRFSAAEYMPQVAVDPAEVQKKFEFRKESMSQPETRSLVQVPAKDAAQAAAVAGRLQRGEDPAAVAKSIGREPIVIADKPKSAIPDRKVADAAFALTVGGISAPIQGDLGFAVVKVTKITPGQEVTLDALRPSIEAELRAEAAAEKVYEQTQAYDDAHAGGATLAEAAAKAKAQVVTIAPVSAQGIGENGQPVPGLNPAVLKAAFELPAGGESEVTDAGQGEYFAVRVERIVPPALPPLETVRADLSKLIVMQRTADRMRTRAEALAERIRKGENLEAVAASAGASVQRAAGLSRATAQQNTALGQQVLQQTFAGKTGEVFSAQAAEFAFTVGKLDAIRAGDMGEMARGVEGLRPRVTYALFRDMGEAMAGFAKVSLKVKTNLERARMAIGVDPATLPDATKTDAKK